MNKIKGAVFDMDGTLVDSLFLWDKIWSIFGENYRADPSFRPCPEDDRAVRTMTLKDVMDYIHARYEMGKSGEELLEMTNRIIMKFYRDEVCMKDGALEYLHHLNEQKIPCVLATATAMPFVKLALEHCKIRPLFAHVLSCADLGKGKEFPDIYLLAAERMGLKPEEICVFEDSLVALRTAKAAGMATVGIYDPYNYGQKEIQEISDIYINKDETLKKLIPNG